MIENGYAGIVRECWLELPDHYPHVSLDAFVIMPDHLHGIIVLRRGYGADPGCMTPVLRTRLYTPKRSNVFRTAPRYPPPK
jgi:REP element-mobilizing transposase RayT